MLMSSFYIKNIAFSIYLVRWMFLSQSLLQSKPQSMKEDNCDLSISGNSGHSMSDQGLQRLIRIILFTICAILATVWAVTFTLYHTAQIELSIFEAVSKDS